MSKTMCISKGYTLHGEQHDEQDHDFIEGLVQDCIGNGDTAVLH